MTDDRGGRTTIGDEIFEQVEKLVEGQGMRRTDAFKKISADTGRREGTVAANYYRVARKKGATLQPRTRRSGGSSDSVDAALERALASVKELANLARAQEDELNALREQSAQLEKLRKMLNN